MALLELIVQLSLGFVLFIGIESSILIACLRKQYAKTQLIFAGVWLTFCTYPVINLLLATLLGHTPFYYAISALMAPLVEFILFWIAFESDRRFFDARLLHALFAIATANIASFTCGLILHMLGFKI